MVKSVAYSRMHIIIIYAQCNLIDVIDIDWSQGDTIVALTNKNKIC